MSDNINSTIPFGTSESSKRVNDWMYDVLFDDGGCVAVVRDGITTPREARTNAFIDERAVRARRNILQLCEWLDERAWQ